MTTFSQAEQSLFAHHGLLPASRIAGTTRYLEVGGGRPILYLHGGGGCAALWAPLVAELGRRIGGRHLLPDRPGFGLTPAVRLRGIDFRGHAVGFVRDFLDTLAIDRVDIVANSMGSLWSLWFARAAPDRVRSLTLLGAPAFVGGGSAPLPMRLLGRPVIGRLLMALEPPSRKQVATLWRRLGHDPVRVDDRVSELMLALEQLPDYARAWRNLLARCLRIGGAAPDVMFPDTELAELRVPISLVWGKHDPFGDLALGERIAQLCHAQLRAVDGGHLPWLDQPGPCAEAALIDEKSPSAQLGAS
jgi:pimeloyl-ACP methyl ester carboxylesterase